MSYVFADGESHVGGAERHDAIVQAEFLQDGLGVVGELFEFVVGSFGTSKLYQLHFLKLVLANDSADVFAIRSGFAAKAGRVGGEADRQACAVENFVAIEIGDWDFGGRNQPKVFFAVRHAKQILRKLRQLAGAVHRFGIHEVWRQHFGVSVLAGVQVEHEVGESALETRAPSAQ